MKGGGRVSTAIRDLLALAEPGWSSPSSSQYSGVPDGSPFAATYDDVPRRPPPVTKKPAGGGVACNPEIGVGLLAAVAEPAAAASARLLRVAEPVRAVASAGVIIAALANNNNLVTYNGKSDTTARARRVLFRGDESLLDSCKLCRRRLDDRTIYLYKDKGFCMPECRYEYFREELYEQRRLKRAERTRESRRAWRNGKASLDMEAAADRSYRRILFVSDDDDEDSGAFT